MAMTNAKQAEQKLYGERIAPDAIRFERLMPGPIERVWEYITDSEKRGEWFARGTMDLRIGGAVNFEFNNSKLSGHPNDVQPGKAPDDGRDCSSKEGKGEQMVGKILRIEKPRLLEFTFDCCEVNTTVLFELEPRGNDTLLRITHSNVTNRDVLIGVTAGWQTHVGIMADKIAGVMPQPFWATHGALAEQYEKLFG